MVIQQAVWLYFRFSLSRRDIEDLLAERGIEVCYETIRCWTRKFGQQFAGNLRRSRPKPTATWHLDEMVVRINGTLSAGGAISARSGGAVRAAINAKAGRPWITAWPGLTG